MSCLADNPVCIDFEKQKIPGSKSLLPGIFRGIIIYNFATHTLFRSLTSEIMMAYPNGFEPLTFRVGV